jgi:hypothetical protein
MRPTYTPDEAREVLRFAAREAGSLDKLAARLNTSGPYLQQMSTPNGRDLSATVARQMGLRLVKMYVPIEERKS